MSIKEVWWAQRNRLETSPALLLRAIASHVNRSGTAWPSEQTLGREANGISSSTIKRGIRDLKRLGLITVRRTTLPSGNVGNVYTLNTGRVVVWDKRIAWRDFIEQEVGKLQAICRRPGESKMEFANRAIRERAPFAAKNSKGRR